MSRLTRRFRAARRGPAEEPLPLSDDARLLLSALLEVQQRTDLPVDQRVLADLVALPIEEIRWITQRLEQRGVLERSMDPSGHRTVLLYARPVARDLLAN